MDDLRIPVVHHTFDLPHVGLRQNRAMDRSDECAKQQQVDIDAVAILQIKAFPFHGDMSYTASENVHKLDRSCCTT